MIDLKNLKGADLTTELCGIKLQSPFILSSGPLTYAAEGMIRAHQAGCGAVVTKTIRHEAAINPVHHIGKINSDSLINCEKWADSPAEVWFEREIPMAKKAGCVVIASVGHTYPEAHDLVKPAEEAGADMIELVSYTEDTILPMLETTLKQVKIPVLCKLSGNWPDPVSTAKKCLEMGAAGITAIDSIGPTLKIDIKNARPEMMGPGGTGWLSGGAIRPIALRINSEIARNGCPNLVGTGGVTCAEDAVEYLMVGCNAIGVHSIAVLKGVEYFEKLCRDLAILLEQLGYKDIPSVRGVALPNFPTQGVVAELEFNYEPDYAPCQQACPAGVDVPLYLDQIRKGQYIEAYKTVSVANPFPAICGRVCDHPCEGKCRRAKVDDALQIRLLKRAAADRTFASCGDELPIPEIAPSNGKKVAIVGAGPAGLSAAYYLAKKGYSVKVFEALPIAGGMLAVGIPDYRLPKDPMNKEIARLEKMGVEIRTGVKVGLDVTMDELKKSYDSVLIAVGAHGDSKLGIVGEDLPGVIPGVTFLRDVNLGRAGGFHGKKVVVVGGGNVAIDAARSAVRLGAEEVIVVYRRTEAEMPAYAEEVAHAKQEGVKFTFLAGPNKIEANGSSLKFFYDPMTLGEADASGRRKPVKSGEPAVAIDADYVIVAVGQVVDAAFMPGVKDAAKGLSAEAGVFVAGDCATGPASVIKAIAAGREAAASIDQYLGGDGKVMDSYTAKRSRAVDITIADGGTKRAEAKFLSLEKSVPGFAEVELGLDEKEAEDEANRCLHCGCTNCQRCVAACSYKARTLNFPIMTVDKNLCRHCGACVSVCPTGALTAKVVNPRVVTQADGH